MEPAFPVRLAEEAADSGPVSARARPWQKSPVERHQFPHTSNT